MQETLVRCGGASSREKMHVCSPFSTLFLVPLAVVTVMQVVCAVPLEELYPFGPSAGDRILNSIDDGGSGQQIVDVKTRVFGRQVNISSYFVSCCRILDCKLCRSRHAACILDIGNTYIDS